VPHYLVCYDISSPKRLAKVHRRILAYAIFVQFSVYYLEGSQRQLNELLAELSIVINEAEDDVRAYAVAPLKDAIQLGRSWLPSNVFLV
jgi:CRISPR-associated protein Cas2